MTAKNTRAQSKRQRWSGVAVIAFFTTMVGAIAPAWAAPVVVGRDRIDVRETIPFAAASAEVPSSANALLDALAQALKENPRFTLVRIEGHTDATGSPQENQTLSQARADAVRQALVERGVPATRLVAKGFGASDPLESNATDVGRRRNRRVVVEVLQIEGKKVERPPLAKISEKRNQVAARAPLETRWLDAAVGDGLRRSWRVRTEADSAAGLTFRDASRLAMREQTLVIIYGATEAATRATVKRAALESGALAAWLDDESGHAATLAVQTKSGDAKFTGGRAVARTTVSAQEKRPAVAFSNQSGQDARVVGKDKSGAPLPGGVDVKRGYGSRVIAGKVPDPPVPLPAAPNISLDAPVAIAIGKRGGVSRGKWTPSAKSAVPLERLLVEVKPLDRPEEAPLRVNVDAQTKAFRLENLPPGKYAIRASAIDRLGLEGPFSKPTPLEVRTLSTANDGAAADAFMAGEALVVPEGWTCAVDDLAFDAATATILRAQTKSVRCRPLIASATAPAAVAPLSVAPAPALTTTTATLPAGQRATLVMNRGRPWTDKDVLRVRGGTLTEVVPGATSTARRLTVDVDPTATKLVVEGVTRGVVVTALELPVLPDTEAPAIGAIAIRPATEGDGVRVSAVVTDRGSGIQSVLAQVTGRREPAPVNLARAPASDTFVGDLAPPAAGEAQTITLWATDRAGNGPTESVAAIPAPPGLGPLWLALPAAAAPVVVVSLALLTDAALSTTTGDGPLVGRAIAEGAGQSIDSDALSTWQSLAATSALLASGAIAATGVALFLTTTPSE